MATLLPAVRRTPACCFTVAIYYVPREFFTDAKGSHVQLFDYDAYGEPTELHRRRTVDPSFRFNEQPFDTKHRLYFYQSRFYDPKLSRFISPDSSLGVAFAPQSLNGYSYVQNNPRSYTDMTGMQPDDGDGDHGGSDDSREPNVPDHPDNAKDYSPPDIVMVYRVSDSQKSAGDESGQDSEDKDQTKRRDTSPIDRENFGNNRFQSGDVRLTSEYVFNAGFAASLGTGGDRWALSFGSAVSVNLLAGKVSILPALASAMVGSTKGDSVIAGATLGFDVGMGQGSLAGVLGPSKTDVVAAVAGSVTLSENELYRAASLSFGWGKEVGAVSGNC